MFEMLRNSAVDQGFLESLAVTEADVAEDGFGPQPKFTCLIAEKDRVPAGIALYYFDYSTWVSRMGLFLEDLYVNPQHRRAGVAQALLRRLTEIARSAGCRRMHWLVHRENTAAMQLYRSFGARSLDEWMIMTIREQLTP